MKSYTIFNCFSKPGVFTILLFLVANTFLSAQLSREEAVDALLDPGSGVFFDPSSSAIWSPFVDFGPGASFEGMLHSGSTIEPAFLVADPYPASAVSIASDAYFFWIDDAPTSQFVHPTRFVILDANIDAPSVDNGGIVIHDQGWWPKVFSSGSGSGEYFSNLYERVTDNPPGFDNPEGFIAGVVLSTSDIVPFTSPNSGSFRFEVSNACGLLLRGSDGPAFEGDIPRWESDLKDHYGVQDGRIVKANDGNKADFDDLKNAITALCQIQDPACDKIFIRFTSHGYKGGYILGDDRVSAQMLCQELRRIAKKGVPICMIINGCNTGSLLDANNWNFPAGSVIITAADANRSSWGGVFREDADDPATQFGGSLYPHAHSKCLRDQTDSDDDGYADADANKNGKVDDCEAHEWVKAQNPCYTWTGNNKMYYPAGSGPDAPNPNPQIRKVGKSPDRININIQNQTGKQKTVFYIVFDGDVRAGYGGSWRSDQDDNVQLENPWGQQTEAIYDPFTDETIICYEANPEQPAQPGEYIHFGYYLLEGELKAKRQFWSCPPEPLTPEDRVPTTEEAVLPGIEPDEFMLRLHTRTDFNGGWNDLIFFDVAYRISPEEIPLENLFLGHPSVAELPVFPIGQLEVLPGQPFEFPIQLHPMAMELLQGPSPMLILETRADFAGGTGEGGQQRMTSHTMKLAAYPIELGVALPIKLSEFEANPIGNQVRLDWKTASETHNAGFEIQRATETIQGNLVWQVMDFVESKNTEGATYSWIDKFPKQGSNFYRLQQMDEDGRVSYSTIELVDFTNNDFEVVSNFYPNPVSNGLTSIEVNLDTEQAVQFFVFDNMGRLLKQESHLLGSGRNITQFNWNDLPEGQYRIWIEMDRGRVVRDLVVVNR